MKTAVLQGPTCCCPLREALLPARSSSRRESYTTRLGTPAAAMPAVPEGERPKGILEDPKEAAGTPRARFPPFPSPHHHQQALGGLNGAMRRGSRGGGRQAGEEVISPQLAPLPRSLKGRRKPPGPAPPPRGPVSSVARPQPTPHQSGCRQWVSSSRLGHTHPQTHQIQAQSASTHLALSQMPSKPQFPHL